MLIRKILVATFQGLMMNEACGMLPNEYVLNEPMNEYDDIHIFLYRMYSF